MKIKPWRAALAAVMMGTLAGCGGGGGDSEVQNNGPEFQPLSGLVFDGPIANADVAVYKLDQSGEKVGGSIDTGVTDNLGQITDINRNLLTDPPYLVEVTANDQSIDFDTREAPVLKNLTTLILDPNQEEIHATPLTSLATNSALDDDNGSLSFEQKVSRAVNRVIAIVPVEMSADIDLFKDSPVPTREGLSEEETAKISQYWTASQAALSMMHNVVTESGDEELTTDEVLDALAKDLTDGNLDGKVGDEVISEVFEDNLRELTEPDLDSLTIPGTTGTKVTSFAEVVNDYIAEQNFETPPVIDENNDVDLVNPDDKDNDEDGIGNKQDPDDDNDGLTDAEEKSVGTDPFVADTDGDKVNDKLDAFPLDHEESTDTDADGIGNNADPDDDNDGLTDAEESELQTNPLKSDSDDDGVNDKIDAFPLNSDESVDTDGDGTGNNADTDDDNDGLSDAEEGELQTNPLKADSDDDGVNDKEDTFPLDTTETVDSDNDGTGNNADTDDDNDGLSDEEESRQGTDPLKADSDDDGVNDNEDRFPLDEDESSDRDNDGVGDESDNCSDTANPGQEDSDSDGTGDACQTAADANWDNFNWDEANWQ
ncbi:MAG: hypothetical protein ACR2PT_14780 [Endozoicomonas sp.]